jgi:hypothetical protein
MPKRAVGLDFRQAAWHTELASGGLRQPAQPALNERGILALIDRDEWSRQRPLVDPARDRLAGLVAWLDRDRHLARPGWDESADSEGGLEPAVDTLLLDVPVPRRVAATVVLVAVGGMMIPTAEKAITSKGGR